MLANAVHVGDGAVGEAVSAQVEDLGTESVVTLFEAEGKAG